MDTFKQTVATRLVLLITLVSAHAVTAQHLHEDPPINYEQAEPENCVTRLQAKLDTGELELEHDETWGYLPAVLKALNVPVSSQALVFSKTSLQVSKISPRRPRAIYFGDDVYIGWVQRSKIMEISAVDPKLGGVFYVLEHTPAKQPQFVRKVESCLSCHATRHSSYMPGHVVFSVYSDWLGSPVSSEGFTSTDHRSAFKSRWGGWYVTGKHGDQRHLGNRTLNAYENRNNFDYDAGANVTDLSKFFDVDRYLSPHSDLIALMVMEHQAMAHNRLTAAGYRGRIYESIFADPARESEQKTANYRLDSEVSRLVDTLLMAREATLSEPISGTSGYAKSFSAIGPHDSQGRSLRALDLKTRLFRYPCSYLIHSEAFDGMPKIVRDRVYRRMWEVLSSDELGFKYRHITLKDRQAVIEILREIKPEVNAIWPADGLGTDDDPAG